MTSGLFRRLGALLAVTLGLTGALAVAPAASQTVVPRVDGRIMVQGDSISAGFERPSYRRPLLNGLAADGCSVDMVGDQTLNSLSFRDPDTRPGSNFPGFARSDGFDIDHQAFGGITTDQYANGVNSTPIQVRPVGSYVSAAQPDYVLLHLGTNDLNQAIRTGTDTAAEIEVWADQTAAEITTVIDRTIAAHANPAELRILLANFIPYVYPGNAAQRRVSLAASEVFTEKLEQLVETRADSRVLIVDVATGFDPDTMTTDGVHPNGRGERHIARAFLHILRGAGLCADRGPAILEPAVGTTVAGTSTRIRWTNTGISGNEFWRVRVGDSQSGWSGTYFDSGWMRGRVSSLDVDGLPADGSNVFVTVRYAAGATSGLTMGSFISVADEASPPELVDPAPAPGGPALDGPSQTFTWTANGTDVRQWWFRVGSSFMGSEYFDSGRIRDPNARSVTVTGLPTDGSPLQVTLWYRDAGGTWANRRYNFTAATTVLGPVEPDIVSPRRLERLAADDQLFTWTPNGTSVRQWWVRLGSIPQANDYFDSGRITDGNTRQIIIPEIPAGVGLVYLTLWYYPTNGPWTAAERVYQSPIQFAGNG